MATIEMKFSKGDVVWAATTIRAQKRFPCPDCGGSKKWKAVSPAGGEYEFNCPRCSTSFRSDHKMALDYDEYEPHSERLTIGQLRYEGDGARYMCVETGIGSGTVWDEWRLHPTEEAALAAARILADEQNSRARGDPNSSYSERLLLSDYQLFDGARQSAEMDAMRRWRKTEDMLNEMEDSPESEWRAIVNSYYPDYVAAAKAA